MTIAMSAAERARCDELSRSAARVRAGDDPTPPGPSGWRRFAVGTASIAALGGLAIVAIHAGATATEVRADGSADAALFSLTNQDRSSNGVRSLSSSGTLQSIGEGGRYTGCGFAVNGRAVDMIQRNYFAHSILGCGQTAFSMMQAFGVRYLSAGENIGWNTYPGAGTAAGQINSAFMGSADHRANILNGAYTTLGVGSYNSGAAAWTGGGGSYTGAWMFAQEFAQLTGSPPPPPPPPPPPRPRPTAHPAPPRNSAAPTRPAQAAAATGAVPAPTPTATPTPTPAPTPVPTLAPGATPLPSLTLPPLQAQPGGLLFTSVESVLENYLDS